LRRSALAVLRVTALAALGVKFLRGGLTYPLQPSGGGGAIAGQSSLTAPSASGPALVPASLPTPTEAVASESIPPSTPTPSPSVAPTPPPTPSPTARPTSTPASDRYAVLTPCSDQARCWLYVVRSGDNLFSIAHWFGIPLATVRAWNPWTETSGLRAGQTLRLPPPTR
jgi:hypothetical protein